jgi:Asp-tRNA(Asn)/Glu-tRNA(Gln) amidotransferase B subunit
MEDFIQRVEPPARRILAAYGIPQEDADDMLNQLLLATFYQWEKLENSDQAARWFLRGLTSRCSMYKRQHQEP